MSALASEGILDSLAPYRGYRESAIGWIGRVPDRWELARLKAHLIRNDGGAWGSDAPQPGSIDTFVLRSTEQTIAGGWRINDPARRSLTPAERHATLLRAGDLLVTKSSGSAVHIGKTTLVTPEIEGMECGFSNFMQRLRADKTTSPTFLWYCLNSSPGREQMVHLSSTTTGLGNLSSTILGNLRVAFPPPDEQAAIVRFLDHADRRIQRAIRAKKRLIALLNEQKAAIIHRAVTRGLDPSLPLKPSGVAWLGDVPAHWEVASLGNRYSQCLGKMLDSKRISGKHSLPYLRNIDVQWNHINVSDLPVMDIAPPEYARYTVRPGDLLVCEGGEVGRAAIYQDGPELCGFQKALHRLRPLSVERDSPRYLLHVLRVAASTGAFNDGHESTIAHLTGEKLRRHRFPFPPKDEQVSIVNHLDATFSRIDAYIDCVHREISLLQEFRTRLIGDVVTGKLDVRAAAANLPDDIEEEEPGSETDLDTDEMNEDIASLAEEVAV